MSRVCAILAAAALAVAATGCGDDEPAAPERPVERATTPSSASQLAEAQELTRIDVPDGAADVQARVETGMDASATLRFTADASEAYATVRAAGLDPQPGFEVPPYDELWRSRGWPLAELEDPVGAEENTGTALRVVVLDERSGGRTTVYAYASTT